MRVMGTAFGRKLGLGSLALLAVALASAPARAEVSAETAFVFNTFSFLVHGFLVMWMAAGFAMLEAGLVRTKNTATICLKNIALYSIAGIMYYLIGYSLMYTDVAGWIGSLSLFYNPSEAELERLRRDRDGWYAQNKMRPPAVIGPDMIRHARQVVNSIYVDDKIKEYILDIIFATRDPAAANMKDLRPLIEFGASPRATINLNLAAQGFPDRIHHCSAKFVKHHPRGLVTTDPELALELLGRDPGMVGGHEIGRPEPRAQRRVRGEGGCRVFRRGQARGKPDAGAGCPPHRRPPAAPPGRPWTARRRAARA